MFGGKDGGRSSLFVAVFAGFHWHGVWLSRSSLVARFPQSTHFTMFESVDVMLWLYSGSLESHGFTEDAPP